MSTVFHEPHEISGFSATSSGILAVLVNAAGSTPAERVPDGMPASIPADQAYYWSMPWQVDVRESMRALADGDVAVFDSDDPTDVARWLFSDDE